MIRLLLANEVEEPERSVKFELRRHLHNDAKNVLYLVAVDQSPGRGVGFPNQYPVTIYGHQKEFKVRRNVVEQLGFKLVVED